MELRAPATFALKKDWHDPEPGIEVVELRYILSPVDGLPDWSRDEDAAVLAPRGDGPLFYRSCAIELPCGLDGALSYTMHYYFLVIQHGRQRTLPVAVEQIVSKEVAFHDGGGRFDAVAIQWSIGSTSAPNYTPLSCERVAPPVTVRTKRRAPTLKTGPLSWPAQPSVFKGSVWGPRGATVHYVVHLRTTAGLDLWDSNGGGMWHEVL